MKLIKNSMIIINQNTPALSHPFNESPLSVKFFYALWKVFPAPHLLSSIYEDFAASSIFSFS